MCFRWLRHEQEESTADEHARESYNIAGLLFFVLFWITHSDVSMDKVGAASGRALGESR